MIQANELRIGNIFWESYGGYGVVTAINRNNKGISPDTILGRGIKGTLSGQFGCEDITPISLTTEILEMVGFIYSENDELWGTNKSFFIRMIHGKLFLFNYKRNHTEIKYLHQLQNIYFSLTGDELEFKL